MAIYNSMLNIMPYNCRYCVQGFKGLEHVSEEARIWNLKLIELQKGDAVKEPIWDILASMDPIFVNGFGHGNTGIYTGDTEEPVFTTEDCSILANRVVHLLSCFTAVELGPAIINAGGLAYAGYDIAWTWFTNDAEADPYTDYFAEGFYRSDNEFPIALIQGGTVRIARYRCRDEYNRWIEIWETDRADSPYAAESIKWLIHDRDGLTVLGNLEATITSTVSEQTVELAPGESQVVSFEAVPQLAAVYKVTVNGLFGSFTAVGVADIRVENLVIEPIEVPVGETVSISVTATNIGTDVGSKTITCKIDGGIMAEKTVTLAPGESMVIPFETTPTEAKTYEISVDGLSGSFTAIEVSRFGKTSLGVGTPRRNAIDGSWATCPEAGIADSMSVHVFHVEGGTRPVRCALYKRSDYSFVAATEEKIIGRIIGWVAFDFPSPKPPVENIDYILVVWSGGDYANRPTAEWYNPGRGFHQSLPYNNFPDPYVPDAYNTDYWWSIYCTYIPAAGKVSET